MIALILAETTNHVIGNKNDLPWYLSADLQRFRALTTGHTVIMGRNTYDAILGRVGKALPNRRNIVVSRTLSNLEDGFELAGSLEVALRMSAGDAETYIIGGATLFQQSLDSNLVDKIFLTKIEANIEGDTFFEEPDPAAWMVTTQESHKADEKNDYNYTFMCLEKK